MSQAYDLRKTRNNLVAKDNRLIQNSRFSLTPTENKAVLYLISKIQPEDTPGKRYLFNCKEFQALIKWSDDASYTKIKDMLTRLASAQWWMDIDDDGNEALVRWFNIIHMNRGTGDIEISFHDDMFPMLLDLQKHLEEDGHFYTTYKLQCVSLMKHRYSARIYELLKSYQFNNRKWIFENGTGSVYDLQRRIADTSLDGKAPEPPKNWSNWAIFKRDVLDPAVMEINKYTDIKVAYEGKKFDIHKKKTHGYRTIEFYMVGKTSIEQRETDDIIDAEYQEIEEDERFHQFTIEELFFKEHE
jgi:plasmid replication initiation protein